LGLLYDVLLGFRIIIDIDFLKCKGQYPRLMCKFAILTMLTMYLLSPTNTLRYLQEIWLGPGVDELLHLLIASTNSATENGGHSTY